MNNKFRSTTPDLPTQYEDLLHQVWTSEADWRLWDRIDASVQHQAHAAKRLPTKRTVRRAA